MESRSQNHIRRNHMFIATPPKRPRELEEVPLKPSLVFAEAMDCATSQDEQKMVSQNLLSICYLPRFAFLAFFLFKQILGLGYLAPFGKYEIWFIFLWFLSNSKVFCF